MHTLTHFENRPYGHRPTVLTARTIHNLDPDRPSAEALLVIGPQIAAVGLVAECQDAALEPTGRAARTTDLGDAVVVQGFIDAHAHPLVLSQMMSWMDCGPSRARSIPEIVALLRAAAEEAPLGAPVCGYGYEHRNLAEGRHPTRWELDDVATDREVYLMNASGHGGVVKSATLERYGVDRDTPNPPGGEFFRDAGGELTGELADAACNVLSGVSGVKVGHHGPNFHLADEPGEHLRQLRAAQREFLAGGVTTIGDAQVSRRELATYLHLAAEGQLEVRVSMYLLSHLLDHASRWACTGSSAAARLSFAGIQCYADGTLGAGRRTSPTGTWATPAAPGSSTTGRRSTGSSSARRMRWACRQRRTRSRPPWSWSSRPSRLPRRSGRTPTRGTASSTAACRRRSRSLAWPLPASTRSTSRSTTTTGARA
jgi:predicted amidohydrolase YtcJ